MRLHICLAHPQYTSPRLIIRAFNVVEGAFLRYSAAAEVLAQIERYLEFVHQFTHDITSHPPFATTDIGKRVVASVLFHPIWNRLKSVARGLPSRPGFDQLRNNLDTLEAFKNRHALHNYVPLSWDWTAQLYPDDEPDQPHVTVDMPPEARVEEEVVGRGDGTAALNVRTQGLSCNPLQIRPYYRRGHSTVVATTTVTVTTITAATTSSARVAAPARMETDEELYVAELRGDARVALHEGEDEDEDDKDPGEDEKDDSEGSDKGDRDVEADGPSVGRRLSSRSWDRD